MFPYESLDVYKKAFAFNQEIYRFLKIALKIPSYIKSQLGRASLSIMLNIAEGSAKFSIRDRRNFFITARSSVFECAAIMEFLAAESEIPTSLNEQFGAILNEISRMLFTMIKNLDGK